MNRKRRVVQALVVVAGAVAVLYLFRGGFGYTSMEGQAAPDFTLPSLDGGEVLLSGHLNKEVVVLDFWASWCPPCRASLPALARLAKRYAGRGVAVYAVNKEEDEQSVREFLLESRLELPVLLDTAGKVADAYGVHSIPRTLVIDKAGVIQADHLGYSEDLEASLGRTLDSLISR